MVRHTNTGVAYAPLYVHRFCLNSNWFIPQLEINKTDDFEPSSKENIGDNLRLYRMRKRLRQVDVSQYAGISRCVYANYEKGVDTYPLDKITKIAELLEAPVIEFIDDYNNFIQKGQGSQIRELRKSLQMSQRDFANFCGVDKSMIGKWESNKVVILKRTWESKFKNIKETTGD